MFCESFFTVILILISLAAFTDGEDSNDKYEDTLKEVLSTTEVMQQKISELGISETTLKQSVGTLTDITAKFQSQIAELTKDIEDFKLSDVENKKKISALEKKIGILMKCNGRNAGFKTETCNHEIEKNSSESIIRVKRHLPQSVTFAAYLDRIKTSVGQNQPIVYNRVLQNEAGAYSLNTGIFRVPVSGLYLLSWSVTARRLSGKGTHEIWVKLMVNGHRKFDAVAESQFERDDNQGSSTVILRLQQGDEVWIAVHVGSGIFGDDDERTTSFTGVLLH